jgi:hypothetical protein
LLTDAGYAVPGRKLLSPPEDVQPVDAPDDHRCGVVTSPKCRRELIITAGVHEWRRPWLFGGSVGELRLAVPFPF